MAPPVAALAHAAATAAALAPRVADGDPQPVTVIASEGWQDGVVLVYSTAILIGLRLASTVRHSPLSPVAGTGGRVDRAAAYAAAMVAVGLASSGTLLGLSLVPATRDTARDLMPVAAPLLAAGGLWALTPQTGPPDWDKQALWALMGGTPVPFFLAAVAANALTVAASVLNGAWASTSISVATTLIALFGPRTPLADRAVGRGLVEPSPRRGFVVKVVGAPGGATLVASFWPRGVALRDVYGDGWRGLHTLTDTPGAAGVRLGIDYRVVCILADADELEGVPMLDAGATAAGTAGGEDAVDVYSAEDTDRHLGTLSQAAFLRHAPGEEVHRTRLFLDDFTLSLLGNVTKSAVTTDVGSFPGAPAYFRRVFLRLLVGGVSIPTAADLGLPRGADIDVSPSVQGQVRSYQATVAAVEAAAADLDPLARNLVTLLGTLRAAATGYLHAPSTVDLGTDAVAQGLNESYVCRTAGIALPAVFLFDSLGDAFSDATTTDLPAVVLDEDGTTWVPRSEFDAALPALRARVACWAGESSVLDGAAPSAPPPALGGVTLATRLLVLTSDGGRLARVGGALPVLPQVRIVDDALHEEDVSADGWARSRGEATDRQWPVGWEAAEPLSRVGTVKGLAEVAALQAFASSVAVGSVLLGRLLG